MVSARLPIFWEKTNGSRKDWPVNASPNQKPVRNKDTACSENDGKQPRSRRNLEIEGEETSLHFKKHSRIYRKTVTRGGDYLRSCFALE
jgi:hypothetical protein